MLTFIIKYASHSKCNVFTETTAHFGHLLTADQFQICQGEVLFSPWEERNQNELLY